MPEPPVISGRSAAASPIASRSRSAIASTIACRNPCRAQRVEGGADRGRPLRDRGVLHEPDPPRRLALQDAHEGGIAHRRQRMVAHARFRQQHVADEQIALDNRPAVLGKSRAEQR